MPRFVLMMLLLVGSCREAPSVSPDAALASGAAECGRAADCEVVSEDCCSCSSGGKQKAIARSKRAAYEKRQETRCGVVACPTVLSNHASCFMDAGCQGGRCELVPRQP